MKKYYILFFVPVIVCAFVICTVFTSDTLYFTEYIMPILIIAVMLFAGVTLCKGKIWGAILAVILFGTSSIWDYYFKYLPWLESKTADTVVVHSYVPVYYIYVPLIIFYLFCIYKVKKQK